MQYPSTPSSLGAHSGTYQEKLKMILRMEGKSAHGIT